MGPLYILTFISCLLLIVYGLLIVWYFRVWTSIPPVAQPAAWRTWRTWITVVVPARNEEGNILRCLDSLASQSYPRHLYEVIVVDDHSTDGTAGLVEGFGGVGLTVRCIRLSEQGGAGTRAAHKKWAVESGIKAARGQLIVATDADCTAEPGWLAAIAACYEDKGAKFIAAPVRIASEPGHGSLSPRGSAAIAGGSQTSGGSQSPRGSAAIAGGSQTGGGSQSPRGSAAIAGGSQTGGGSQSPRGSHADHRPHTGRGSHTDRGSRPRSHDLLSIFQTLDFITLQGITGAAVYRRVHSMCNGANLAYEKSAFEEVGGFSGIDSIPSGDDMLLMHKIYCKYPQKVFFLKDRHAIVTTRPESSWSGFFHQRVRWASKADRYDDKRIFWVLLLVYLVNLLLAGLFVAAFWNTWWLWILLLLLIAKTAVEYPFVRSVAGFFGQQRLMVYFAVLQPVHILYTIVVGWLGKFGSYQWKDRKISK